MDKIIQTVTLRSLPRKFKYSLLIFFFWWNYSQLRFNWTESYSLSLSFYIYIYIYTVIHRQTVLLYRNTSVWLDTLEPLNSDWNPPNQAVVESIISRGAPLESNEEFGVTQGWRLQWGIHRRSSIQLNTIWTTIYILHRILLNKKIAAWDKHCWRSKDRNITCFSGNIIYYNVLLYLLLIV